MQTIALAIIVHDAQVLLVERHRPETGQHGAILSWSFPGGKIEPGEVPTATAIRETTEETGIVVAAGRTLSQGPHPAFPADVHYIACSVTDNQLQPHTTDAAITQARWIPIGELAAFLTSPLNPAVRAYLTALQLRGTHTRQAIVGVGAAGSGKTTLLKPLAAALGYTYINGDDIRAELTGAATNHTQEAAVWKLAHSRIGKALETGGVIIDATYAKKPVRQRLVKFCREHGAQSIDAYWLNVSLQTSLERNRQRTRQVPESVIHNMHNWLVKDPPTLDDGFDSLTLFTERQYSPATAHPERRHEQ